MKISKKDRVKLLRVPSVVEASQEEFPETFGLFKLAVGKEFLVRGIDEYGHVEVWAQNNGEESNSPCDNTIWVEPDNLEKL